MYELISPDMGGAPVQWSEDTGQAKKIYSAGESVMLKPNANKINLFTCDGETSLLLEARQHD